MCIHAIHHTVQGLQEKTIFCKTFHFLFVYMLTFVFAFVNSCNCIYHLFIQKYLLLVFAQGSTGDYWPPLFARLVHCLSCSHHYFWQFFRVITNKSFHKIINSGQFFQVYYKSSQNYYFWPNFQSIHQ